MKNRLFIIILFLISVDVIAQTKVVYDTLVVYDTVVVYDTLYISDNIGLKSRVLKSDLTSFFFDKKTATFFRTDIIVNENKQKTLAMKKITALGILLFSLNHGLLAQTRLGVTAGATAWSIKDNDNNISNPVSGGFRLGIFSETRISKLLSIAITPTYYFLKGGATYKVTSYYLPSGQWLPDPSYIDEDARFLNQFFHSNRHQLAIAFKSIATFKKIRPFAGIEYTSTIWTNDYEPFQPHRQSDNLGFIGGLSYRVSNSMEIDAEYYTAFSMGHGESHHTQASYAYGYQRLTLGIRYFL